MTCLLGKHNNFSADRSLIYFICRRMRELQHVATRSCHHLVTRKPERPPLLINRARIVTSKQHVGDRQDAHVGKCHLDLEAATQHSTPNTWFSLASSLLFFSRRCNSPQYHHGTASTRLQTAAIRQVSLLTSPFKVERGSRRIKYQIGASDAAPNTRDHSIHPFAAPKTSEYHDWRASLSLLPPHT